MNKIVFAFPGQGSQYAGMGKSVYENYKIARETFAEVDAALGLQLSKIILGDNQEEITLTYNAQPGLMCVSIAILRVLEQESGKKIEELCSLACGHSLGEYSALCAAGAVSLSDCAKILSIRGHAMNNAAPAGTGGMAAILGASDEQVAELLQKSLQNNEVLVIANDNSLGQTVISGSIEAINRSIEISKDLGIKRAVKLPVSGPFHSPLMQKAKEEMIIALQDLQINVPKVPVIANFTAKETQNPTEIRNLLAEQVTGAVKWRQSIMRIEELGYENLVEIGAGKVLAGLTKRTSEKIQSKSLESIEDINSYLGR